MRIDDIAPLFESEIPDDILAQLLDQFKKTSGEFNNASHKFYSVRKALLQSEEDSDRQKLINAVTPRQFFEYLKAKKNASTPTPHATPQEPVKAEPKEEAPVEEKPDVIVPPTIDDVVNYGTTKTISMMVSRYGNYFSANEIIDAIKASPVHNYEDSVFIRDSVNSEYAKIDNERRKVSVDGIDVTPAEIAKFKASDEMQFLLRQLGSEFKEQARNNRSREKTASAVFNDVKSMVSSRLHDTARTRMGHGDEADAMLHLIKKKAVEALTAKEFFDWYRDNKTSL